MEIDYAAVTRDEIILVQYSVSAGNYDVILTDVLNAVKIADERVQFDRAENRFFILHLQDQINFVAVTKRNCKADMIFKVLTDISRTFLSRFSGRCKTATAFELQSDFSDTMDELIRVHQTRNKVDTIQRNLNETSEIMLEDLEMALERGTDLDVMHERAKQLQDEVSEFRREARKLEISICVEKWKWLLILLGIITGVLIVIIPLATHK